jgi:hypothetical protein
LRQTGFKAAARDFSMFEQLLAAEVLRRIRRPKRFLKGLLSAQPGDPRGLRQHDARLADREDYRS